MADAQAQPAVTNGGFEAGDSSGWAGGGPSDPAVVEKHPHTGRFAFHCKAGRVLSQEFSVDRLGKSPAIDAWFYPVRRAGTGKVVLVLDVLGKSGYRAARVAYVLKGNEDYGEPQNCKVGDTHRATVVLDAVDERWFHLSHRRPAKDFDAVFGAGSWDRLAADKYRLTLLVSGDVEAYIDDINISRPAQIFCSPSDMNPEKAFDGILMTEWSAPHGDGWWEIRYDDPQKLSAFSYWAVCAPNKVEIQYWDDQNQKYLPANNQRISPAKEHSSAWIRSYPRAIQFDEVQTTRIRLVLKNGPCALYEVWPGQVRTWITHRPEFYTKLRKEIRSRIETCREQMDLKDYPEYLTEVVQSEDELIVKRQMWQLAFSKKSCAMTGAVIRGRNLSDGFALSSLEVVDANGVKYFQSLATDGKLNVTDEKLRLRLDGRFTPKSKAGKAYPSSFGVSYYMYKMSGMMSIRYTVENGGAAASEVKIRNTLGRTARPLKHLMMPYWWLSKLFKKGVMVEEVAKPGMPSELVTRKRHMEVIKTFASDKTRRLYRGNISMALWTDGGVGFQYIAHAETANEAKKPPRDGYVSVGIENGKRYTDVTFIEDGKDFRLNKGQSFSHCLALLPYKKYKPNVRLGDFSPTSLPRMLMARYDELTHAQKEAFVRRMACRGVRYAGDFLPFSNNDWWTPEGDKTIERIAEITRLFNKYGIEVAAFRVLPGCGPFDMGYLEKEAIIPAKQVARLKEVAQEASPPGSTSYNVTMDSPEFRDTLLINSYLMMAEAKANLLYFDTGWIWALIPGYPSNVEGNVRFAEDLNLLCETFDEKKGFGIHEGFVFTPFESIADFMLPGEGMSASHVPALSAAKAATSFNALLAGTNVFPCDQHSFDMKSPELYKQWLANAVSWIPAKSTEDMKGAFWVYPGMHSLEHHASYTREPDEIDTVMRYYGPLLAFDVENSTLYDRFDPNLDSYVKSSNKKAMVNLYSRPNETLAVVTLAPYTKGGTKLTFNLERLGIDTKWVLVYDIMRDSTSVVKAKSKKLVLGNIDLTKEPRIFLLKAIDDPDKVVIFWSEAGLKILEQQFPDPDVSMAFVNMDGLTTTFTVHAAPVEGRWYKMKMYCGKMGPPLSQFPPHAPLAGWNAEQKVADIKLWVYAPEAHGPATQKFTISYHWLD
ncbi:MAG: hypothetical protein SVT52_07010 [Planctomycetota bacterium]|nr:hypothetical protein [Planctomycetota bacterium]